MRIELTQGCICYSFTADDRQLIDMSAEELKDILNRVVKKVISKTDMDEWKKSYLQDAIRVLVEDFPDEYESAEEPCECCGDWVETYYMEV